MRVRGIPGPNTAAGDDRPTAAPAFDSLPEDGDLAVDDFLLAGGHRVRLRIAGTELRPLLTRALDHTRTSPPTGPDLVIDAWTAKSGLAPPPHPPWPAGGVRGARLHVRGAEGSGREVTVHHEGRMVSLLDGGRRRARFWAEDASDLEDTERGAPLRFLLGSWLQQQGALLVHAAAVGTPAGCLLLVGPGGAGKSTTALACLAAGFGYLSDDYCAMTVDHDAATIHSVYCSAKVEGRTLERLPALARILTQPVELTTGKRLFFVDPPEGGVLLPSAPLRAVLVMAGKGAPATTLQPASRATALRAMAPSTMFQLPGDPALVLGRMAALLKGVPCYRLTTGSDLQGIAPVLSSLSCRGGDGG